MNWDQIAGQWKPVKGKAKQKWGRLSDDELYATSGLVKSRNGTESPRKSPTRKLTCGSMAFEDV
jgi:hypothetical protein